jgi:EAL domain-containing protein (putative c-di-GMP-specific phosphodiesterase class I)
MQDHSHAAAAARANTSCSADDGCTAGGSMPICYVVDEDAQVRRFLSLILLGQGVRTEEFSDTHSFLQAVTHRPADLVFLNVGLDSAEVLQLIETLGKGGYFGFLQLMSTRGSAVLEHVKKIAEQKKLIALPILLKPFKIETVVDIVRSLDLGDAPPVAARFALDEALANNWIEYWYQPKIDLRQKQLIGAEAFVRARHPKFGVVPPAAFLPGAADSDLVALAEHSVTNVLKAGVRFSQLGLNLQLAVNMSMNALVELPIVDIVRSCRSKLDQWPGLIIDINEVQIITQLELATEIAKKLMTANVYLAIDDFGRGLSSLKRVKELPFAELKLGPTFVADCGTDKGRAPICRTVIELAHNFESMAVAVGIEKASDATALVSMGCDYGQGFLLGRPLPEDRFVSLLQLRTRPQRASHPRPLKASH